MLSRLVIVLAVLVGAAHGQTVPSDREDLVNSAGSGMARYADMNGFPGPKHVLEFRKELGLTESQVEVMTALYEEMRTNAGTKGEKIILQEEKLNQLFADGTADEETVTSLSREIGRLRGELRAIHLVTHLRGAKVLTDEQSKKYNDLRHGNQRHHEGHH